MASKVSLKLGIKLTLIFSLLVILFFNTNDLLNILRYEISAKKDIILTVKLLNPQVSAIASESSNRLYFIVAAKNSLGENIPKAHINLSVSDNLGKITASSKRTDTKGEIFAFYSPPEHIKSERTVSISARLNGTDIESSLKFKLIHVPVVFIHGYNAEGSIFDSLREFLSHRHISGTAITYDSKKGVSSAADDLDGFINKEKASLMSQGIQVNKFDIIAHSMGGLVARYYTCSQNYIQKEDIRKIIFASVPQKGSPWASIAAGYYANQGIADLIPDSQLISHQLPGMLNKGLNTHIQAGSIIAQFDEVVSLESSSLDEWIIPTDVFSIGENNFTVDKFMSGNIMEAPNHKNILNNKKVFEKISEMLDSELPYPSAR
ncbi:MAG: alpha/beta hydrolase [Clostridia bacterium]|nr:alpha/beta hydrolase [Clostridia bacterium]